MTSQEFCLKWNNHHVTLVSVLDRLLSSETLVDVTLVAEGKSVRVHRVVLAACSTYFQDIVDLHQDKSLVIFLKDVKYVELQALVDYMYRGEVRVAQNSLASLIRTAESLKIKGLAEAEDESQPQETIESKPPDRDSPIRKRRRRSGESFSKKDLVPPAPPLQPAPVIQIKEDEPLVVPVASTPRVVKQVPPPPPLAPAVESVHSSDIDLHNVESNSADFVKEYVPHKSDDSVNHGQSPVLPKFELSGDELGNDTDHGQEEEWNEEDFSALVSEQSGNAETGEPSRSIANNSQQVNPVRSSMGAEMFEDTDLAALQEENMKQETNPLLDYEIFSGSECSNGHPSEDPEASVAENLQERPGPSNNYGSSKLLIITKEIFPRTVQAKIGEPLDDIMRLIAVKSLCTAILDHYGNCVTRKELKKICEQLTALSSVTFGDCSKIGKGRAPRQTWLRYLEDGTYKLWRKMGKGQDLLVLPKKSTMFALQPSFSAEEFEHMKKLKIKCQETREDVNIHQFIYSTYALQRSEINSFMSLKELKNSWPLLFTREGITTHFNLLVKCDAFQQIAEVMPEIADQVYQKSCEFIGSGMKAARINSLVAAIDFACGATSSTVPRQDYLWQLLLAHAGELEDATIEHVETLPDSSSIPAWPPHPRILVQGPSTVPSAFLVIARGVEVVRTESMREAVTFLFATYWIFDFSYPKRSEITFHFFMKFIAGFDRGISKTDRNVTRIRERCEAVARSLIG